MSGIPAFVVHSILITALVVVWKHTCRQAPLRGWIVPGLCLKILAGIAVGLLFQRYYGYGGDSWNIHHSATELARIAQHDIGAYFRLLLFNDYYHIPHLSYPNMWEQPRYLFVVKLISVVHLFTFSNYWLTSYYLSFFAFFGLWQLANTLTGLFPTTRLAAAFAFLLFPSVLFWSSGLQKESLAIGLIGLMVHQFLLVLFSAQKQSYLFWVKSSILWLITIAWLWKLKFYYLGGLLPVIVTVMLTYQVSKKILNKRKSSTVPVAALLGIFLVIFTVLLFLASLGHPKLHPSEFMHVLVLNHNASFNFSAPDDVIHYTRTEPGFFNITSRVSSLLYNSPKAFASGLLRPFIWEANNKVKLIAGLENVWVLVSMFYTLVYIFLNRRKVRLTITQNSQTLLIFTGVLTYISLLATLLAIASPNLGSLARYKVGFLPFMIYLIHLPINYKVTEWLDKRKK